MIENWRDLVGVQDSNTITDKVFFVYTDVDNGSTAIFKESVGYTLTEEEVCDKLDEVLTSFSSRCENDKVSIARAQTESTRKHGRGIPNTTYKNAMYYRGASHADSPKIRSHGEHREIEAVFCAAVCHHGGSWHGSFAREV